MSEDNILNLEEDPSPSNDSLSGEPLSLIPESGIQATLEPPDSPAALPVDPPTSDPAGLPTGLPGELAEVVGSLLHGKFILLQAGLQTLSESLQRVDHQLNELTTTPATANELDGVLTLLQRKIAEKTSETERLFEQRLENARQSWSKDVDELLEVQRQEMQEEAASRVAAVENLLEASREALALAIAAAENSPVITAGSDLNLAFNRLKTAIDEINSQRSQADTLSALIQNASYFAPRIAFFVVKAGVANGWKSIGFNNGLNDESIKSLAIPVQNDTTIGRALLNFETARSINEAVELGRYGSPAPNAALAIPLVVRGRAAAVLYADSGDQAEDSINQAALETIMRVGGMGIELLPTRRAEPAPPQTRGTTPLPRPTPAPAPAPSAVASPGLPPGGGQWGGRISDIAPVASGTAGINDAPADAQPFSTRELPKPVPAVKFEKPENNEPGDEDGPEPGETAPTVEQNPPRVPEISFFRNNEESAEVALRPEPSPMPEGPARITKPVPGDQVEEPVAPAPVFAPAPPQPPTETEQRAHNDARRFARLLVSEIKLYNAAKVSEGRRNLNLYSLLSEEIDRSRKVYDRRVSPAVATKFDYFYDELLQTLAEGDAAKLGGECPGPILR